MSSFRNFWLGCTPMGLYLVSSFLYLYFLLPRQKFQLLRIPMASVICFGPECVHTSLESRECAVWKKPGTKGSVPPPAPPVPPGLGQYRVAGPGDWTVTRSVTVVTDGRIWKTGGGSCLQFLFLTVRFLLQVDPSRDLPYFKGLGIVLLGCMPPTGSSLNSLYFWILGTWFFSI